MSTGYEDIEKLTTSQNEMLDKSLEQQQDITNKQTEMNVAELERNKQEVDRDATKTNRALYAEYRKASNPYGANAEQLASQGLANSGYAESTQANLYNTFQRNVTDTLNNARELKSNFDFEINKARQTGDITLAQNALAIYQQKMQLLTQEYELKNNREQFLYQKERDALAQSNWEKEYAYQQSRDAVSDQQWLDTFNYNKDRDAVSDKQWQDTFDYNKGRDEVADSQWKQTYDYNKSRDKVSDSQWNKTFDYQKKQDKQAQSNWEKEYQLSKKASASSSRRRSSSGSTSYYNVRNDDENLSVEKNENNKKEDNKNNKKEQKKENKKETKATNYAYQRVIMPSATQTVASKGKMTEATKATLQADIYRKVEEGKLTEKQAEEMFEKLGL